MHKKYNSENGGFMRLLADYFLAEPIIISARRVAFFKSQCWLSAEPEPTEVTVAPTGLQQDFVSSPSLSSLSYAERPHSLEWIPTAVFSVI